jgi:hypothetical protein
MLDEPNNNPNDGDLNEGYTEEPTEEVPAEQSNNRTFWIVGGILGLLILLTLGCVAAYVFYLGPRLAAQRNTAAKATADANAVLIQQLTATAQAALWTPTSQPTATSTKTAIPTVSIASATPVVAQNPASPTNTSAAESSTLAFLQTQLASQMTSTAAALIGSSGVGTPGTGGLATTGFFDEVGLPSLVVLTLALLAVILLARRLRGAQTK